MTFVLVSLTDAAGIVKMLSDRQIRVSVLGNGILRAIGNGNPVTEEAFDGDILPLLDGADGILCTKHRRRGNNRD